MKIFRINSNSEQESRDRKLREKMAEHSVTPPAFVWDKIDGELQKPARNRRRFILFLAALAACVAGITFGVLTFLHTSPGGQESAQEVVSEKDKMQASENNNNYYVDESLNKDKAAAATGPLAQTKKADADIVKSENGVAASSDKSNMQPASADQDINNSASSKPLAGTSEVADMPVKNGKINNRKEKISQEKHPDSRAGNFSTPHKNKVRENNAKPDEFKNKAPLAINNNYTNKSLPNKESNSSSAESNLLRATKETIAENVGDKEIATINKNTDSATESAKAENVKDSALTAKDTEARAIAANPAEMTSGSEKKTKTSGLGKRWSLGIHAAPGVSFRSVKGDDFLHRSAVTQDQLDPQSSNPPSATDPRIAAMTTDPRNAVYVMDEKPGFSYSAGISAGYKLSKKLSLQSGFYYMKSSYLSNIAISGIYANANSNNNNTPPPPPGGTGVTNPGNDTGGVTDPGRLEEQSLIGSGGSAGNYNFTTNERAAADPGFTAGQSVFTRPALVRNYFEWIRLPLQLRYTSGTEKIQWFVQTGFTANILVNKYAVLVDEQPFGAKQKTRGEIVADYNNFGLGTGFSAGLAIDLGKNISLELRPEFEYTVNSIIGNSPQRLHPYFFQFNTGLVKKF